MPTIDTTLERYFAAIRAFDADTWADCYSDDAVVNDPAHAPCRCGRAAQRAFFVSFAAAFRELDFRPLRIFVCGDEAAVVFQGRCVTRAGKRVAVEGIDVFVFDVTGRICRQRGYWDPAPLLAVADA